MSAAVRFGDPAFHLNVDPDLDQVFRFNADTNPAFHFNADLDPAPHQSDGNLRPRVCTRSEAPFALPEPLKFKRP